MFNVKLEIFEGPLDLLLYLVDKNQLDITEISLAAICGDYEDYILKMQELNLEIESSYITVFASLLEIKSKVLLPVMPKIDEEDEEEIPEHELVEQLKEYKRIKEAAVDLSKLKEKAEARFSRPRDDDMLGGDVIFTTQLSAADLMDLYVSVLRKINENRENPQIEVVKEEISFPFILRLIAKKVSRKTSTYFFELFDTPPDKLRFVVTFLALLEMARRNKVTLIQDEEDGHLTIINNRRKTSGEEAAEMEERLAG